MEDNSATFRLTIVNTIIVAVNLIFFAAVMIYNGNLFATYDADIMLRMGAMSYNSFMNGRYYELITAMFLHFGFSHLANNMVLLTYAGCELERRVGHLAYIIIYFGSGIAGNVVSLWHYNKTGEDVVSAGASGAIFGVIGALIVFLIFNPSGEENLTPRRLLLLVAMTIYYGYSTGGVNNAAHVGGLCFGIISCFILSKILHYGKLEIV
ncbi:MAG: rhomboid family intramembrane serine protease [Lachnospiraceae bacterium]|jgi:rhomboid protease GluP|nr:rhomboid family intramembrane serine protease [Lachnospiraceae bacterium]